MRITAANRQAVRERPLPFVPHETDKKTNHSSNLQLRGDFGKRLPAKPHSLRLRSLKGLCFLLLPIHVINKENLYII